MYLTKYKVSGFTLHTKRYMLIILLTFPNFTNSFVALKCAVPDFLGKLMLPVQRFPTKLSAYLRLLR